MAAYSQKYTFLSSLTYICDQSTVLHDVRCYFQVTQMVLSHGQGLWLGPDSDGLLNYCDAGRTGLSTSKQNNRQHQQRLAGKKEEAGPSNAAASVTDDAAGRKRKELEYDDGSQEVQWPTGIKDVASLLSSISIVADRFNMPQAAPPGGMISKPRPFQLQVCGG